MPPRLPGKILVPFPASLRETPIATHCRSTVLVASIQAITHHGWMDAYKRIVAPNVLEPIENAATGSWLPIELAIAHYSTCDRLGVSLLEQIEIGGEAMKRLRQTILGTVVSAARSSGAVTPLTALLRFNQLHARSWIGSGGQLVELGPKDVRLDIVGLPLLHIPYFRASFRGFLRASAQLFSQQAFVSDVTKPGADPHAASFRFAWV